MSDETAKKKSETSVKDTIESILVAFILAFIFRCFVVEAFVIPTGSMAPTLLGAHMDFRCPDCGYQFTAGYHTQTETFSIPEYSPQTHSVYCPNCGYQLPQADDSTDPENDAKNPPLRYGDRILVMKYTYLFNPPQRWDVVVFKSPFYQRGTTPDYSINYIKRLVGLPGESLFLGHGDLYVATPDKDPSDLASYQVQAKPRWVQDALWRIVFDADYVPQSARLPDRSRGKAAPWVQPWKTSAGSGWVTNSGEKNVSPRQFVFDNASGSGVLAFDPAANPTAATLSDWLAYDQTGQREFDRPAYSLGRSSYPRPVGDLKLCFFVSGLEGDGTISAVLTKTDRAGTDEFIAEVSRSGVRLLMKSATGEKEVGRKDLDLSGRHAVSIENVDYKVVVRIDDDEVLATTPRDYAPDVNAVVQNPADPPAGGARLEGDRARATISHLQLWRDIYYRDDAMGGLLQRGYAHRSLDGVARMKPAEYFVLGDNSLMSLDARFWEQPIKLPDEELDVDAGVVPDRFMLGKAFFVYWPAGYKPIGALPLRASPNFGQMRFIR